MRSVKKRSLMNLSDQPPRLQAWRDAAYALPPFAGALAVEVRDQQEDLLPSNDN
jgi:hypothetical protein